MTATSTPTSTHKVFAGKATKDKLKIFISYAREDAKPLAQELHDDLTSVGLAPWLDLSDIAGGASWSERIEQAIEECDLMLALLSAGSYKSEYCRAEQLRAIRKGKRIIPLLVQPDADRPIHLEHLNYVDFSAAERYDEKLRDLLSDITAGQAFQMPIKHAPGVLGSVLKSRNLARASIGEKRGAGAFRRHLTDLRRAEWLGARYWWPYFLFTVVDMSTLATTLQTDALLSPAKHTGRSTNRWDDSVRLHFRPRTPDTWSSEGIRPVEQRRHDSCHLPVYLLFDLEAIICQQNVRFSAGDPVVTKKTYSNASAFSELPFEMIYHDSFVRADERDEVMQSRRAQVIIPNELGLETLQFIWCRSSAEYETLRSMLPTETWRKWRDKITPRTDYILFHRRWAFVEEALLTATQTRLRFNVAAGDSDRRFEAKAEIIASDGRVFTWHDEDLNTSDEWLLDFAALGQMNGYTLKFYLDDVLAYWGNYQASDGIL